MMSQSASDEESKLALWKIIKVLIGLPAKILFYGSALLAIAATGGVALPGVLATLAASVGGNLLANMLERVAKGENLQEDEIQKTVKDAIKTSGIDKLATSHEFQHTVAHMFRQFDLVKYAVQKGETNVVTLLVEKFKQYDELFQELRGDLAIVIEQSTEILTSVRQIGEAQKASIEMLQSLASSNKPFPHELVDMKIEEELDILRKSRIYAEYDRGSSALTFARKLTEGEFSGGSDNGRCLALAWCARVLSITPELSKAEEYLELARRLGTIPEIGIAQAFILSQKGDKYSALRVLATINLPSSRSAALMITADKDGFQAAIDWLKTIGFSITDLCPDGKNFLITYHLQLGQWGTALELLAAVTNVDILATPILSHTLAITHLLSTVPDELRMLVLIQPPFEAASFPLASDEAAIIARRKAKGYFLTASQVARELNCYRAAKIAEEYELWLELMDPLESLDGKERLRTMLNDSKSALRVVHLGLQFGIPIVIQTVEREIEQQLALNGGYTFDTAKARLALAFAQKTPEESANYVARYRDQLAEFIDKKFLLLFQIEMFMRAGLHEKSRDCFDILVKEGISESERSDLERRFAEIKGADPIEGLKEQYRKTDSLGDLISLVHELERKNDWENVCEYSQTLFERTHSLKDAERLAYSLSKTQKNEELIKFIAGNKEFLEQSRNLQMYYCWSLYENGELLEARSELAKLSENLNDPNFRALQINLGISLGDWNSVLNIVDNEWVKKDKRSAQELIGAAQLGLNLGSPRAKELILAAADKGREDANILTAAYMMSFTAGWEDDEEVSKWINEAAELSGDDGPVQKKSLKDILNLKPEWERHESEISDLLCRGEIPVFLAAQSLNKSLIYMMLLPALANLLENDPRRRGIIPAYSGTRQPISLDPHKIVGFDATALITLSFLNLLDKALDAFDIVYVPHSTLAWLFEEKGKAAFHQPSRIRDAHQLRNFLATDVLQKFVPTTVPEGELADLVGEELALLIAEAEKVRDDDPRQCIVVRSAPVYSVASLMGEEADLSSHAAVLSSCQSIVDKLRQKGAITAEEYKKSRAFLQFQEKPWLHQPEISDGAILYLDDLTLTHFIHLGILDKLQVAGYRSIASPRKVTESDEFISYENISTDVNDSIEHIRAAINSRIVLGKIKVGRRRKFGDPKEESVLEHPTVGVIDLTRYCDAIITDDRSLNRHSNVDDGGTTAQLFTTLDVIDTLVSIGSITSEERLEFRTKLRQATFFFVPIDEDELAGHLNASIIKDDKVIEIAELKAIRENIVRVRMSTWLQLPQESPWLDTSLKVFIRVLQQLWKTNVDLSSVRVRSNWILNQFEVRGWAHRFDRESGYNFVNIGRAPYILMLFAPLLDTPQDIREEYWGWVEEKILAPIKEQFPNLYSWIVDWHRNEISKLAELDLTEGEKRGE